MTAQSELEQLRELTDEAIRNNQELLEDVRNLRLIMEVQADNKSYFIEYMKAKIKHWREK